MSPRGKPRKVFIRPPADYWDLSDEEQLAWARQVGQDMAAALGIGDEPGPADEPDDGPEPTDPAGR